MEVPPPLICPDSRTPRLRKHKGPPWLTPRVHKKTTLRCRKAHRSPILRVAASRARFPKTCKLVMRPGDGVRRIRCTTYQMNVHREAWAGRPQVPETLKQAPTSHYRGYCMQLLGGYLRVLCSVINTYRTF